MASIVASLIQRTGLDALVARFRSTKVVITKPNNLAVPIDETVFSRRALDNLGQSVVSGPSIDGWKFDRYYRFSDIDAKGAALRAVDYAIDGSRVTFLDADKVVKGFKPLDGGSMFGPRASKYELLAGDVLVANRDKTSEPTVYKREEFDALFGRNPDTGDFEAKPRGVIALHEVATDGVFKFGKHQIKVSPDAEVYLVQTGLGNDLWQFMLPVQIKSFDIKVKEPLRPDTLPAHLRPTEPRANI